MTLTLINEKIPLKFKETYVAEVEAVSTLLIEKGSKTLAQELHLKGSVEKAILKICGPRMNKALLKPSGNVLFRVKLVGAGAGMIIVLMLCSVLAFLSLKVYTANKFIAIEMICIP